MAKKAKKAVKAKGAKQYHVHKKLEQPVHNMVGYGALLILVVVVFVLVSMLKGFNLL